MEEITNMIQPELLVIIPILYAIGCFLKNRTKVSNRLIPLLVTAVAILMAIIFTTAKEGISQRTILNGIWQGILCAAAAVYTHQMYKQAKEEK